MDTNPTRPLSKSPSTESETTASRTTLGLAGMAFGGLCGAFGGFLGGAFGGCTYRLFHDCVYGGGGIFGLFVRLATPLDFALFHGMLLALSLGVFGSVLGAFQGIRVARVPMGILGVILFGIAGALAGLLSGIMATNGVNVLRQFVEGPLGGASYGAVMSLYAWMVFRRRVISLARQTRDEQVSFAYFAWLVVVGAFFVSCVAIQTLKLGTDTLQLSARFGAIMSVGACFLVARSLWKHWIARRA